MIMAAGLGTRLRPFTDRVPKPLVPIMGLPVIQFAIDQLQRAGVANVVANSHHLSEVLRGGLLALESFSGVPVRLSDESELLLGSGGGIRKALPLLGDSKPFFLLNADVISNVDLEALAQFHLEMKQKHGVQVTLAIHPNTQNGISGKYREIVLDAGTGLIRGLGDVEARKPFFIGTAIVEPEAVRGLELEKPSEFVPEILWPAIRKKKAAYFEYRGPWFDIGSAELWQNCHFELMKGLEQELLPAQWANRLLMLNEEVCSGIWVSHSVLRTGGLPNALKWRGPVYWAGTGKPPERVGERVVVYGDAPPSLDLEQGHLISWNGLLARTEPRG